MTDDPLQTRAGDGAVFQQLVQRAFDEDMRQALLPVDLRRTDRVIVLLCGSGRSGNFVQAMLRATAELGRIWGELDRLDGMVAPEPVGAAALLIQSSSAEVISRFWRVGLASLVRARREEAAALKALLALLRCALEQLLGGARPLGRERVVRTAASPCGVIGLTTPRVPRAPGPVRLVYRTEPTAGAAAA
ncbi:hypothetical protein ABT133_31170 [Streptomyces sp. NPDC001835]|uniref:hypothetical protein n=1 Tax=Streptomyces sp. NPDC001835 TaxID=3154528 RepID=UPI003318433F